MAHPLTRCVLANHAAFDLAKHMETVEAHFEALEANHEANHEKFDVAIVEATDV